MSDSENISKLIQEFSSKYLFEVKGPFHSTPNTRILTEILPSLIHKAISLGDEYRIYGSVGSGNWSEIPWLAILDRSICSSTTQGYYVVILFDKSMQNVYLSLAVGWTQFENEYGIKEGKVKIRALCDYYANLLHAKPEEFKIGRINLRAENKLGKGYETGTILSKKYSIDDLTDGTLSEELEYLVSLYTELKGIVGNSILNLEVDSSLFDESLSSFRKKVASESFSENTAESMSKLIEVANQAPPDVRQRLKKEIVRNRKFANYVKERAGYICQICGRKPFIQVNGKPYAEADHINQLGGNTHGLDSPDNMRCVCAQCHAVITHGSDKAIKDLITIEC